MIECSMFTLGSEIMFWSICMCVSVSVSVNLYVWYNPQRTLQTRTRTNYTATYCEYDGTTHKLTCFQTIPKTINVVNILQCLNETVENDKFIFRFGNNESSPSLHFSPTILSFLLNEWSKIHWAAAVQLKSN